MLHTRRFPIPAFLAIAAQHRYRGKTGVGTELARRIA
jgi:hypothetical protein